jgi:hypothetical protein
MLNRATQGDHRQVADAYAALEEMILSEPMVLVVQDLTKTHVKKDSCETIRSLYKGTVDRGTEPRSSFVIVDRASLLEWMFGKTEYAPHLSTFSHNEFYFDPDRW